ncbi:MAG: hypothetical protein KAJ23_06205 [Maribacter sp.]|nr:hypothetical protein [Maribacter sp.]
MVFLTALYIIIPISLLKKRATLKRKPNQDGDRLLKEEEERTGKVDFKAFK